MIFDWFKIFNLVEFNALGLVSRTYSLELEGIAGIQEILVTKGNTVSMTYQGVMLALNLNDENPFRFDGFAIYVDENQDVFLGIEADES